MTIDLIGDLIWLYLFVGILGICIGLYLKRIPVWAFCIGILITALIGIVFSGFEPNLL